MSAKTSALSVVFGPTEQLLWTTTLGALIETQAIHYGDRNAAIFPSQNVSLTYRDLLSRSKLVAKALLESGLQYGDRVGITAGNCYEYIEVFLGAARIGCETVVLNSTYTPQELLNAVRFSGCKLLCAAQDSGPGKDLSEHLKFLDQKTERLQVVLFNGKFRSSSNKMKVASYNDFIEKGRSSQISDTALTKKEGLVRAGDTLNLQFTSGTTGAPKAAMLTHLNLINNGKFVGDRLNLTPSDVVCCAPPLFHCFGLVMGFLGTFTHGSAIVFPSLQFDPNLVLDAIEAERCTVLYGVPTMFVAELDANKKKPRRLPSLKLGLAAGSPVPKPVMERLTREMGVQMVLIAYGMTETSPVTFNTSMSDTLQLQLTSVGNVMPHTGGKIIDQEGNIVPRGVRGEICSSGYALQKGYLDNVEKTNEAMRIDQDGILWMHTGDEGVIDENGYCRVTGRIKDMIIRGGENIIPTEIEDRLLSHQSIVEASVVGLPDEKYGEVVAAFLREAEQSSRPSDSDVAGWVRETLGRHKAPQYVFWIGDDGVGQDFPKTGSGKHQKHILRATGARLLEQKATTADKDVSKAKL